VGEFRVGAAFACLGIAVGIGQWLAPPDTIAYEVKFALVVLAVLLFLAGAGLLIHAGLQYFRHRAKPVPPYEPWHVGKSPNLKIDLQYCQAKSPSEHNLIEQTVYHHPCIIEVEATLLPSRPLQVARISLDIDKSELELLGAPLYAETIKLPRMLQAEETFTFRFSMPPKRKKCQARLCVFAAGKDWKSKPFNVYC
jgi:hypothetical protein